MQSPGSDISNTHMHGMCQARSLPTMGLPHPPRPPAQDPDLSSRHKIFHNVLDSAGTLALLLLRRHPALLEPLRQGDTTQQLRSVGFVAFALIPAMVEVSCARLVRYCYDTITLHSCIAARLCTCICMRAQMSRLRSGCSSCSLGPARGGKRRQQRRTCQATFSTGCMR